MWTSVDPGMQFWSAYLYTGNAYNPINGFDPSGFRFIGKAYDIYKKASGQDFYHSKALQDVMQTLHKMDIEINVATIHSKAMYKNGYRHLGWTGKKNVFDKLHIELSLGTAKELGKEFGTGADPWMAFGLAHEGMHYAFGLEEIEDVLATHFDPVIKADIKRLSTIQSLADKYEGRNVSQISDAISLIERISSSDISMKQKVRARKALDILNAYLESPEGELDDLYRRLAYENDNMEILKIRKRIEELEKQ